MSLDNVELDPVFPIIFTMLGQVRILRAHVLLSCQLMATAGARP